MASARNKKKKESKEFVSTIENVSCVCVSVCMCVFVVFLLLPEQRNEKKGGRVFRLWELVGEVE